MLSASEEKVLKAFRAYRVTPEKMLCFHGPDLQAKAGALESLVQKHLLVREKFHGGYSLTRSGYQESRRLD